MSDGGSPRLHVRWNFVRSTAESVLSKHHDGKLPVNVKAIAKALNVTIQPVTNVEDELAGFFFRDPASNEIIIGVNDSNSEVRKRFTIAHELGHLMLHDSENVRYDRKGSGYGFGHMMMRNAESSKGEKQEEVEANFFAAEILMPRKILIERLLTGKTLDFLEKDTDETIRKLANEFEVSAQALTVRLVQLKIIEAF